MEVSKMNLGKVRYGADMRGIPLFHGSKGGILGSISPRSRRTCDFGPAFYLGTVKEQAYSLCLRSSNPHFYECTLYTEGLRVEKLDGLAWIFYVCYNRDLLPEYTDSPLFRSIADFQKATDVVTGNIADDNIYPAFVDFSDNLVTDKGLDAILNAIQLGTQYALLTPKACSQVDCIEVFPTAEELKSWSRFDADRTARAKRIFQELYPYYIHAGKSALEYENGGLFDESFEHLRARTL